MPLSKTQQKAQITRAEKKLAKAKEAAASVEALEAEIAWLKSAPVVEDKPRKPRKVAAAPTGEAPAGA